MLILEQRIKTKLTTGHWAPQEHLYAKSFFLHYKAPQINEEQSTGARCRLPHLDALGGIPKMSKLPVSLFVPGASILALFHLHRDTGPWKQAVLNNFDKNKSQSSGLVPTFIEWIVITGKKWAPHPPRTPTYT